jgi:DNA polymerase alpha subunit A
MQGINARKCLVNGCRGKVLIKYTDKELYDQLCYYEAVFDGQRCLDRLAPSDGEGLSTSSTNAQQLALIQSRWLMNSPAKKSMEYLREVVAKYTAKSGRRFVDLEGLFGWMKVAE